MDGLSVVANIYAVIGAAKTVAEGLRKISNVRHAPQEVLQFINEVKAGLCFESRYFATN